jgi:GrpB-like predicted nucleotidyltransferase (UPF0157 family)
MATCSLKEAPMIAIVPYQHDWPDQFARLGRGLRDVLGDLALRIDHIGSTSVSGLAAKDIIDIQVSVRALTTQLDDALDRAGYEPLAHITCDHVPAGRPKDPEQWRKWFYNERGGARRVNLHVRVAGRANQRYAVLFRDYLRANAEATAAYGQVKMALAGYHAESDEAYYAMKDPVCDIIMVGAEAWAAGTGWVPGPSDK